MKFIVAEQVYEDKAEAMAALADEAEKFVADFAAPQKCEVSGTTTIAGQEDRMQRDGQPDGRFDHGSHGCGEHELQSWRRDLQLPHEGGFAGRNESGEDQHYVVGDAETCCPVDARDQAGGCQVQGSAGRFGRTANGCRTGGRRIVGCQSDFAQPTNTRPGGRVFFCAVMKPTRLGPARPRICHCPAVAEVDRRGSTQTSRAVSCTPRFRRAFA